METSPLLQDLMNAMAAHLDDVLPQASLDPPDAADWPLVNVYLSTDSVLAELYKQYIEAKARLEKLSREYGAFDPMSEVAKDMCDSARSAIDTRLLELQDDSETQKVIALTKENHARMLASQARKAGAEDEFDRVLIFLFWARMAARAMRECNVQRDFRLAA